MYLVDNCRGLRRNSRSKKKSPRSKSNLPDLEWPFVCSFRRPTRQPGNCWWRCTASLAEWSPKYRRTCDSRMPKTGTCNRSAANTGLRLVKLRGENEIREGSQKYPRRIRRCGWMSSLVGRTGTSHSDKTTAHDTSTSNRLRS